MEEPVMCSDCGAEPASPQYTESHLVNEGWDLEGEFGPRCPGCVAENVAPAPSMELSGAAVGALAQHVDQENQKKAKAKPKKPKAKRGKK